MPSEYKLSVRDGERVREVLLVGTVTVGRSPSCEISSPDPRLSRTHACFDVVAGEVVVRDLGSSNGTTVNGEPITEHRLSAGEQVEVGPFIVQLIKAPARAANRRPVAGPQAEDATVMRPIRREGAAPPSADVDGRTPVTPQAAIDREPDDSSVKTRMLRRSDVAVQPAAPPPAAAVPAAPETPPRREQPVSPRVTAPKVTRPVSAQSPPTVEAAPAVVPAPARPAATELTFANTTLLWIVPVMLISFLAGLVPDGMQPDERTPLLRAHYLALATSAVDLLQVSRESSVPIDNVTTALRRQPGVTTARIVGADGRVLAPLDQAGTTVTAPEAIAGGPPSITELGDGTVDVRIAGRTADGRPVVIALTVDPERIHPAPPGSIIGTLLLILSLGAAWLVARQLTKITDTRLSRLGEEVELMTTRQISEGRDPFTLNGGRRILDAVTFALSSAGRISGIVPLEAPHAGDASGDRAAIAADAAFRIVTVDRGCEGLLGINPQTAPGAHLIDALTDQAVSNEVMRLLTIDAPDGVVSGEVSADSGIRLGIDVTKGAGDTPHAIRFRRL